LNCPILRNHNTRKDGTCVRFHKCKILHDLSIKELRDLEKGRINRSQLRYQVFKDFDRLCPDIRIKRVGK